MRRRRFPRKSTVIERKVSTPRTPPRDPRRACGSGGVCGRGGGRGSAPARDLRRRGRSSGASGAAGRRQQLKIRAPRRHRGAPGTSLTAPRTGPLRVSVPSPRPSARLGAGATRDVKAARRDPRRTSVGHEPGGALGGLGGGRRSFAGAPASAGLTAPGRPQGARTCRSRSGSRTRRRACGATCSGCGSTHGRLPGHGRARSSRPRPAPLRLSNRCHTLINPRPPAGAGSTGSRLQPRLTVRIQNFSRGRGWTSQSPTSCPSFVQWTTRPSSDPDLGQPSVSPAKILGLTVRRRPS